MLRRSLASKPHSARIQVEHEPVRAARSRRAGSPRAYRTSSAAIWAKATSPSAHTQIVRYASFPFFSWRHRVSSWGGSLAERLLEKALPRCAASGPADDRQRTIGDVRQDFVSQVEMILSQIMLERFPDRKKAACRDASGARPRSGFRGPFVRPRVPSTLASPRLARMGPRFHLPRLSSRVGTAVMLAAIVLRVAVTVGKDLGRFSGHGLGRLVFAQALKRGAAAAGCRRSNC